MKAIITSILCLLFLSSCCALPERTPNLSSPAYLNASPENKERIARGKIGIGMTIDECKAAIPSKFFEWVDSYTSQKHKYETWRFDAYRSEYPSEIWVYIETKDGTVTNIYQTRRYSPRRR